MKEEDQLDSPNHLQQGSQPNLGVKLALGNTGKSRAEMKMPL